MALGAVQRGGGLVRPRPTTRCDRRRDCCATTRRAQAATYENRTRARIRSGEYGLALRETTVGLRVVAGHDARRRGGSAVALQAQRAELRLLQGHPREAIALALEAAARGRADRRARGASRARTRRSTAPTRCSGSPRRRCTSGRRVDIWTRSSADTRSRGIIELNLGVQAYADGSWDEAVELVRASQDRLRSRAGDRQHAAIAGANLGEVLVSRGELDEAERVLTDARRVLRASGLTPFALFAETQLARCALERGDADAALESLQRIVAEAAGIGHAGIVLEITLYFAQAQARAGEPGGRPRGAERGRSHRERGRRLPRGAARPGPCRLSGRARAAGGSARVPRASPARRRRSRASSTSSCSRGARWRSSPAPARRSCARPDVSRSSWASRPESGGAPPAVASEKTKATKWASADSVDVIRHDVSPTGRTRPLFASDWYGGCSVVPVGSVRGSSRQYFIVFDGPVNGNESL